MANYTDATGQDADELEGNLFGIAPKWNATAYWEKRRRLGAPVVQLERRLRGPRPRQQRGGVNCAQHRVLDRGQLDLSASYTLSSLPSEPQITLNMVNITDEPQHTVLEYDSMMYDYYEPGRTIMLGIRGSF